jgi:hypothetical protein
MCGSACTYLPHARPSGGGDMFEAAQSVGSDNPLRLEEVSRTHSHRSSGREWYKTALLWPGCDKSLASYQNGTAVQVARGQVSAKWDHGLWRYPDSNPPTADKGRDQTVRRIRNMPGESVDWTRVVQLVCTACSFWLFPLLPSEVLTGRLQRWRGGKEPSAVQRDGQLYSAVCMSPNHNSRYSAKGGKRVRMYRLHTSIH